MNAPLISVFDENDFTTPEWLVERIKSFGNGRIGLDPCSNVGSVVKADVEWTSGALEKSWRGRGLVYANPPYKKKSEPLKQWLAKIGAEFSSAARKGNKEDELILLIPARTGTRYFRNNVIDHASAVIFFTGRIRHGMPDRKVKNTGRFDSCLIYFGPRGSEFVACFQEFGWGFNFERK